MRGSNFLRAGLVLVLALTLAACNGSTTRKAGVRPQTTTASQATRPAPVPSGPTKIAVLAPLSGEYALIGQQLVNAAAVALFENEQAGVELVPFDTKGTMAGAAEAAVAARTEGVHMIAGPLFGRHIPAVRNALAGGNIAILSFTNDTQLAGGNVFALGVSVEGQVERLAQFLARNDRRRLLVFGPDNAYTRLALDAALRVGDSGQIEVVRASSFAEDADFNTIAEQVKLLTDYERRRSDWRAYEARLVPRVRAAANPAALLRQEAGRFARGSVRNRMLNGMASLYNQHASRGRNYGLSAVISSIEGVGATPADDFDAVLLPFADDNLVAVGSMLDLYNASHPFAQIVGTNFWQHAELAQEPSFHQSWFSAMNETAMQPFLLAYRSNFQVEPDPIAVLGYYAARVGVTAATTNSRPISSEFVRRPAGFNGLAGEVRFGADNVLRHPLSIYQVTPEGPRELEGQAGPTS